MLSPEGGPKSRNDLQQLFSPTFKSKIKISRLTILLLSRLTILTLRFKNLLFKKAFMNKRPLLATRQVKNVRNILIRAQFNVVLKPITPSKNIEPYNWQDNRCLLHCSNYIKPFKNFKFKLKSDRYHIWK